MLVTCGVCCSLWGEFVLSQLVYMGICIGKMVYVNIVIGSTMDVNTLCTLCIISGPEGLFNFGVIHCCNTIGAGL